MNLLLLNGSPKAKNSASEFILDYLEEELVTNCSVEKTNTNKPYNENIEKQVQKADAIIIAFPLYVDAVPSHLLKYLSNISATVQNHKRNIVVYPISNSGFYEARQNRHALDIIKIWCEKSGLTYGQGIGIGAGGMIRVSPLGKGPNTNTGKVMQIFIKNILNGASAENLFTEPNFPRFLYKQGAHFAWRKQAKDNGLSIKNMKYQIEIN